MEQDIIALVGAGDGGKSILEVLLKIRGVKIKYVYDINPNAPGVQLAKDHGIKVLHDDIYKDLINDKEINLIFEVTGKSEVYHYLHSLKLSHASVIGAGGTKIIFHLLDAQNRVTKNLEDLKRTLEYKVILRTQELEKANKELQIKISETQALNEKLQQINNEKTKYLLQATHQLKAPFAAIQSYADVILDGYTGEIPDETRHIMKKIKTRCNLLSKSIKEMLELANLKSFVTENLIMENVDLVKVLMESIFKSKVLAEKRGQRIIFEKSKDKIFLQSNPSQLSIMFAVFLENAINYSHDNSEIIVSIDEDKNNKVKVSFKDSGIGISKQSQDKIFKEYFRTNEAVEKHENGTGLGLTIAKEIAHIHKAHIDVESEINKGSTFTVIF